MNIRKNLQRILYSIFGLIICAGLCGVVGGPWGPRGTPWPVGYSPGGGYPFDSLPVPDGAAWSLRRLYTSWTGPLIRVCPPSGSCNSIVDGIDIYADPTDPNGWVDVAAIESYVAGNQRGFSIWYDQTGGGHDVGANTHQEESSITDAIGQVNRLFPGGPPAIFVSAWHPDYSADQGHQILNSPGRIFCPGRRCLLHTVMSQLSADNLALSGIPGYRFAAGTVLGAYGTGVSWLGTPLASSCTYPAACPTDDYYPARATKYYEGKVRYVANATLAWMPATGSWTVNVGHILASAQNSSTQITTWTDGSVAETITSTPTSDDEYPESDGVYQMFSAGTLTVNEQYRISEAVHWRSYPGSGIEVALYDATVGSL